MIIRPCIYCGTPTGRIVSPDIRECSVCSQKHEDDLGERLQAAERELTAMAARCAELAERWKDFNHRSQPLIGMAKLACENGDAAKAFKHLSDACDIWDEMADFLAQPLPARAAAVGAVQKAIQSIVARHPVRDDETALLIAFDTADELGEFCDACDALAKLDGAA